MSAEIYKTLSPMMAEEVELIAGRIADERLRAQASDLTFLSIKKAAQQTDINEKTLRKWIREGKLPTYPSKQSRLIRVKLSDIIECEI